MITEIDDYHKYFIFCIFLKVMRQFKLRKSYNLLQVVLYLRAIVQHVPLSFLELSSTQVITTHCTNWTNLLGKHRIYSLLSCSVNVKVSFWPIKPSVNSVEIFGTEGMSLIVNICFCN